MRSFDAAQINLEFSGIPDDVDVTIDAWVAKASDLEKDDFTVDQALNQNVGVNDLTLRCDECPTLDQQSK